MKNACQKIASALKPVFGWGVFISLFAGGLTFFAYVVAIIIGGAEIQPSYVAKNGVAYAYQDEDSSLVATVFDETYQLGIEEGAESTNLTLMDTDDKGVVGQLYSVDENGNVSVAVVNLNYNSDAELKALRDAMKKTTYKFGATVDGVTYFITGETEGAEMVTTTNPEKAADLYLEKKESGVSLYTKKMDKESGKMKNSYVHIGYTGGTGAEICNFLYKDFFPVIVYISTSMILLGLLVMYLSGEQALTAGKKKISKHEGER